MSNISDLIWPVVVIVISSIFVVFKKYNKKANKMNPDPNNGAVAIENDSLQNAEAYAVSDDDASVEGDDDPKEAPEEDGNAPMDGDEKVQKPRPTKYQLKRKSIGLVVYLLNFQLRCMEVMHGPRNLNERYAAKRRLKLMRQARRDKREVVADEEKKN
ncbi:hypothetical protein KR018_009881 [Drosophila ironensis]|nr:hypothetical protein KR018_009881 [Drosophila ironensis]